MDHFDNIRKSLKQASRDAKLNIVMSGEQGLQHLYWILLLSTKNCLLVILIEGEEGGSIGQNNKLYKLLTVFCLD